MIEEFIRSLIVTYVPDGLIRGMVQVIFISVCASLVLVIFSIGSFCINLACLVDRLLVSKREVAKGPSLWSQFKSSKMGSKVFSKVSL